MALSSCFTESQLLYTALSFAYHVCEEDKDCRGQAWYSCLDYMTHKKGNKIADDSEHTEGYHDATVLFDHAQQYDDAEKDDEGVDDQSHHYHDLYGNNEMIRCHTEHSTYFALDGRHPCPPVTYADHYL